MTQEIKKCDECGCELKQSGPYAHKKLEGKPAHKGPDEISFWCTNKNCKNLNKDIKVIE